MVLEVDLTYKRAVVFAIDFSLSLPREGGGGPLICRIYKSLQILRVHFNCIRLSLPELGQLCEHTSLSVSCFKLDDSSPSTPS
jgi:hypothetical protein